MKKTIIIGNWKMNKTPREAEKFMIEFNQLYQINKNKITQNEEFGFGIPAVSIATVNQNKNGDVLIAAQNMHFKQKGAFTGELSVEMLKEVGINSVILGHSERRAMFNESDQDVNLKAHVALENDITPIICVGETLEQYEAGETKMIIKKSILASIAGITDLSKVVIAYEPIWAIGTGKTATAQIAQDICKFIRSITAPEVRIQYGGSVKPTNVAELMKQPDIDGALVGGASLEAKTFIQLLTRNK